jgi:hypothetical protein
MTKIEPKKSIYDSNKKAYKQRQKKIFKKRGSSKNTPKKDKTMSKTLFNAEKSFKNKIERRLKEFHFSLPRDDICCRSCCNTKKSRSQYLWSYKRLKNEKNELKRQNKVKRTLYNAQKSF